MSKINLERNLNHPILKKRLRREFNEKYKLNACDLVETPNGELAFYHGLSTYGPDPKGDRLRVLLVRVEEKVVGTPTLLPETIDFMGYNIRIGYVLSDD